MQGTSDGTGPAGYVENLRKHREACCATTKSRVLAGPAGVAARLAQLIFHIVEALLEFGNLVFLGSNLYVFLVYVFTRIAFAERLLRIRIVLHLRFVLLAL